jgi:hypothetical protein
MLPRLFENVAEGIATTPFPCNSKSKALHVCLLSVLLIQMEHKKLFEQFFLKYLNIRVPTITFFSFTVYGQSDKMK